MNNWYKTAQYYEDIKRQRQKRYEDPQDLHQQIAEEYFSIGQNEQDEDSKQKPSICWLWDNGKLYTKKGPGSHQMLFRSIIENVFSRWRGWYDPNQQLVSAVIPNRGPSNAFDKYTEKDVPPDLRAELRNKFNRARIIVF